MNREQREIKPLLNKPSDTEWAKNKLTKEYCVVLPIREEPLTQEEYDNTLVEICLKEEIKRVYAILRNTKNPREYKQNKKYVERLERKLRQCQKTKN